MEKKQNPAPAAWSETSPPDERDERLIKAFAAALRAEFALAQRGTTSVSDLAVDAAAQYAVIKAALRTHSEPPPKSPGTTGLS